MKKILIISEVFKKGGAGNASKNIFNFLKKNFDEVQLLIPYANNQKDILKYYNFFTNAYYLLIKLLNRFISIFVSTNKFFFFQKFINMSLFKSENIKKKIYPFKPDVILILWFEYILNFNEILKIKNEFNAEIVIYPFDMYNFTGGCRYVQACQNYKNHCKQCPALKNKFQSIAEKNYKNNRKLLSEINPKIIFPSIYAKEFTKQTNILDKKIKQYVIEYPVNVKIDNLNMDNTDELIEKIKAQSKNRKIIFLGAQNLREWRKGIYNFCHLISILKSKYKELYKDLFFILVGEFSSSIFKDFQNNSFCINSVDHNDLIKLYTISDLTVIPSLQEWSSLMMSEVVKLNKFTICFETGSSNDLIQQGVNGYIFNAYDYANIAKKINYYFTNPKLFLKKDYNEKDISIAENKNNLYLKEQYIKLLND
jgi:glycosyltransferase involved in cell wall biosynthesis